MYTVTLSHNILSPRLPSPCNPCTTDGIDLFGFTRIKSKHHKVVLVLTSLPHTCKAHGWTKPNCQAIVFDPSIWIFPDG